MEVVPPTLTLASDGCRVETYTMLRKYFNPRIRNRTFRLSRRTRLLIDLVFLVDAGQGGDTGYPL